jgi:hypothetical protein
MSMVGHSWVSELHGVRLLGIDCSLLMVVEACLQKQLIKPSDGHQTYLQVNRYYRRCWI